MPFLSKGRYYTYGVKTLAEIEAIAGQVVGATVFCSDNFRIHIWDNEGVWMCCDYIKLYKNNADVYERGYFVLIDDSASFAVIPESGQSTLEKSLGMVQFVGGATVGSATAVAFRGFSKAFLDEASVSHGDNWLADATKEYEINGNGNTFGASGKGFITSDGALGSPFPANEGDVYIKAHTEVF